MTGANRPLQLVMGATGFLGSHVTRQLVARGDRVRVLVRPTSDLRALEGLDIDIVHGDVHDAASVSAAMSGAQDVFYCVLDARPWLRDPTPMVATNVGALPGVLCAALAAQVRRFVFTSTVATMAIDKTSVVDETRAHNWAHRGGAYVESRVEAESLVLRWARERGLPAVALCVANTYGPGDHLPTPHGGILLAAALGRMPFHVRGAAAEVVGIDDAARALLLAAEHGRIGERYIVAERSLSMKDVLAIGAEVGGVPAPRFGVPKGLMHVAGWAGEVVGRARGRDVPLTRTTARLMHVMTPLDHGKAVRELGWIPRPAPEAIAEGAQFLLDQRAARRRT